MEGTNATSGEVLSPLVIDRASTKLRRCLKCGKEFMSVDCGNRRCAKCDEAVLKCRTLDLPRGGNYIDTGLAKKVYDE